MRLRTAFAAAALTALFAAAPVMAQPGPPHGPGDFDEHHEWHPDVWWREHHPEWIHEHHPEWFRNHPDWVSGSGAFDDHHVWHDRQWWWQYHPEWVRTHHPNWER